MQGPVSRSACELSDRDQHGRQERGAFHKTLAALSFEAQGIGQSSRLLIAYLVEKWNHQNEWAKPTFLVGLFHFSVYTEGGESMQLLYLYVGTCLIVLLYTRQGWGSKKLGHQIDLAPPHRHELIGGQPVEAPIAGGLSRRYCPRGNVDPLFACTCASACACC